MLAYSRVRPGRIPENRVGTGLQSGNDPPWTQRCVVRAKALTPGNLACSATMRFAGGYSVESSSRKAPNTVWKSPKRSLIDARSSGPDVPCRHAGVVELVDAPDSKSGSERSVGSIPTARTISKLAWVPRSDGGLCPWIEGGGDRVAAIWRYPSRARRKRPPAIRSAGLAQRHAS